MIIGVDAGMLGITNDRLKVGVYWLAVHLLQELRTLDTTHTYRLYSFAPIAESLMRSFGPSMENVVLYPARGWFSLRLPVELLLRSPDVFLGLGQSMPSTSAKTIGFIYDLGFLHHPDMYPDSAATMASRTKKLVDTSSQIVTISHAVKADIIQHYKVEDKKIHVAYPGVDALFTPKGPVHQAAKPYFLYVGSLKPGKNVPFLIRGFGEFHKKHPTYDLYLAGSDFWLDADISRAIQQSGAADAIHRLSFVPDEELARLYRGAVAFVSPSLIEGFGLPVVEAMACGTPVIVSDIAVFDEVVGKAGLRVRPTDVSDLATAMRHVTQKATQSSLVKSGLAQAKQFSWTTFAKAISAQYET